jgi:hypothetical protein
MPPSPMGPTDPLVYFLLFAFCCLLSVVCFLLSAIYYLLPYGMPPSPLGPTDPLVHCPLFCFSPSHTHPTQSFTYLLLGIFFCFPSQPTPPQGILSLITFGSVHYHNKHQVRGRSDTFGDIGTLFSPNIGTLFEGQRNGESRRYAL